MHAWNRWRTCLTLLAALALAPAALAQSTMGNYLGRAASDVAVELGERASFLDQELAVRPADQLAGCIVWQSPSPGEPLDPRTPIRFLCPSEVVVPELTGLTVAAAGQLCATRCLGLSLAPKCEATAAAPGPSEMALLVATQCTPANTLVAPGHTVAVVAGPATSDESDANVIYILLLGALAAFALVLALIFYVRYVSARDELRIFKAPRNGPSDG
jgi:hypothetical protein